MLHCFSQKRSTMRNAKTFFFQEKTATASDFAFFVDSACFFSIEAFIFLETWKYAAVVGTSVEDGRFWSQFRPAQFTSLSRDCANVKTRLSLIAFSFHTIFFVQVQNVTQRFQVEQPFCRKEDLQQVLWYFPVTASCSVVTVVCLYTWGKLLN